VPQKLGGQGKNDKKHVVLKRRPEQAAAAAAADGTVFRLDLGFIFNHVCRVLIGACNPML